MYIIGFLVVWFVLGAFVAPRTDARVYRTRSHNTESFRKRCAKESFYFALILGPVVLLWYFFTDCVLAPLTGRSDSVFERSLIKHDEGYRQRHLDEQERRISKLERDNAKLTKQVLDS